MDYTYGLQSALPSMEQSCVLWTSLDQLSSSPLCLASLLQLIALAASLVFSFMEQSRGSWAQLLISSFFFFSLPDQLQLHSDHRVRYSFLEFCNCNFYLAVLWPASTLRALCTWKCFASGPRICSVRLVCRKRGTHA